MDLIDMGKTVLELVVIPLTGAAVKLSNRVSVLEQAIKDQKDSLGRVEKGVDLLTTHLLNKNG